MLASVLTVELKNHVIISKHKASCGKENKETGKECHFLFLECCGIV